MAVEVIQAPESLFPAYAAARNCYNKSKELVDKPTEDVMAEFLETKIIKAGHLGILEHLVYTFHISGVSRSLSHQLVRHRIASYAQRSQRYVSEDLAYVIPESIRREKEVLGKVLKLLDKVSIEYDRLVEIYKIPKEDARCILPNCTETTIVMTVNARSLIEMAHKRLCIKAQEEIRDLFKDIKEVVHPLIGKYMTCERCGKCAQD
jgi:thymidylate synthase (FAD)